MNDDRDALETVDEQERQDISSASKRSTWRTVTLFVVAAILIFIFVNSQISARSAGNTGFLLGGSCCRSEDLADPGFLSADSCCGSGENGGDFESLRQAGLDFYRQNYGDEAVEAVVEDFGCHQEIHIYRDGQLLNRLIKLNGKISEL